MCSFDGCNRKIRSANSPYCEGHYYQVRRGKPLTPLIEKLFIGPVPPCKVEDCLNGADTKGLCDKHYTRQLRNGTTDYIGAGGKLGEQNPGWKGDDAGYYAVHSRIKVRLGSAAKRQCVSCDEAAQQWAYDHTCPNEKEAKEGPYSTDLSRYQPMCVPCHKKFDLGRERVLV